MSGPYQELHIYEVKGILVRVPEPWREMGFIGHWLESGYSFLFFSSPAREFLLSELPLLGNLELRSETILPYEQWEAGVPLRPFKVGPIWISPPWHERVAEPCLVLDPGVSFGSGFHDSTRGCLHLLVELYRLDTPQRVLDLGTGSGILALFALKLGAKSAVAIDCQPVAVERALANASRNSLGNKMKVVLDDAIKWACFEADLTLANLHLELLEEIMEKPGFPRGRWCILSGFVGKQWERVVEKAQALCLELLSKRWEGAFCSLLFEKRVL